jgi:predicted transcriptional regulator YdeE
LNKQEIEAFYVVGISIRTTNANGQAAVAIEALWGKFWGENIQEQIPNKVNDEIYAVYTDYETDHTGPYTTIIGLSVNSLDNIPEGFVGIRIEKANYQKFVSKGKMPEAVVKTWMEIWQDTNMNRAYKADFTVHGEKYNDTDSAEVETFISLNE